MSDAPAVQSTTWPSVASRLRDYAMLAKFQLNLFVLATVAGGYALGSHGSVQWLGMVCTLLGAGLTAFGAAAWNQFLERDLDARMQRTRNRPLPAGRIRPGQALVVGSLWAMVGIGLLALTANTAAAVIAALIFLLYVGVYTPLKRLSTLNTLVGAVPGALPPVLGWAAAEGQPGQGAWALFAVLFVWQIPHLLSIAWYAREDFARAGFQMLSVIDSDDGRLTAQECLLFSLVLIPAGLLPVAARLAGGFYAVAAVVAALFLVVLSVRFFNDRSRATARSVFFGTLIYIPLILSSLWLDRAIF